MGNGELLPFVFLFLPLASCLLPLASCLLLSHFFYHIRIFQPFEKKMGPQPGARKPGLAQKKAKKPGFSNQHLRHFLVGRVERSGTRRICWVPLHSTQPTNAIFYFDEGIVQKNRVSQGSL